VELLRKEQRETNARLVEQEGKTKALEAEVAEIKTRLQKMEAQVAAGGEVRAIGAWARAPSRADGGVRAASVTATASEPVGSMAAGGDTAESEILGRTLKISGVAEEQQGSEALARRIEELVSAHCEGEGGQALVINVEDARRLGKVQEDRGPREVVFVVKTAWQARDLLRAKAALKQAGTKVPMYVEPMLTTAEYKRRKEWVHTCKAMRAAGKVVFFIRDRLMERMASGVVVQVEEKLKQVVQSDQEGQKEQGHKEVGKAATPLNNSQGN
jgi:hypothetical protein